MHARIPGWRPHVGQPCGELRPPGLGRHLRQRRPGHQRLGQRREHVGQVAQRVGQRRTPLPAGEVLAEQLGVQAAGQQQVAQLDQAEHEVGLAAAARRAARREGLVARGLQCVGQLHVVGNRRADAGLVRAHGQRDALRARTQPLHGGPQRLGQRQLAQAMPQHHRRAARPQRVDEAAEPDPAGMHPRRGGTGRAVPGHREHHGEHRRKGQRPGAQAPGQRHQRQEGHDGDHDHRQRQRAVGQADRQRDDRRGRRGRQHAPQHPLRRVGHVRQARADRTAHGRQARGVAEQQADERVRGRHAQRDAQPVEVGGLQAAQQLLHGISRASTRRSLAGSSCTENQPDFSGR